MDASETLPVFVCYCKSDTYDTHMITCTLCKNVFHPGCLKSGRPSDLVGDVYFKFTCEQCSTVGVELVERIKLQWTLVIIIALYNLQMQGGGKCGFFRWREHICRFIDKHWTTFFGLDKKKSATWHGTVAGALSSGANRFFISGLETLGENGWWSLKSNKLPSLAELERVVLNIKASRKRKNVSELEMTSVVIEGSRKKHQNVVEAAVALKEKKEHVSDIVPRIAKPKKKTVKKSQKNMNLYPKHPLKIVLPNMMLPDFSSETITSDLPPESNRPVPKIVIKTERCISPSMSENAVSNWFNEEINDDMNLNVSSTSFHDPLSNSDSFDFMLQNIFSEGSCGRSIVKTEMRDDESEEESCSSYKTTDTPKKMQQHPDVSRKRKAVTKDESPIIIKTEDITVEPKFTMMCTYEEEQLLKKLESFPSALETNPVVRRLFRKLKVRKLKREKNIPVFDIDAEVRAIRGMDPPEYNAERDLLSNDVGALSKMNQILDRFQVSHFNVRGNSLLHTSFVTRLMGLEDEQLESIISPYTSRILKPFIYRDYETKPLKLRLLEEIISHHHKDDPDWKPPKHSPIDYCYVRPQHIPGCNALCQEFFWPGIDLSETLQYPDFSCVAMYKKVIIGFAFMVPDIKYNEAYISFIFCHPEWRRAGIATFMLYHLVQTCMGKDITLHVSATNPAIFLYHGFGFKIEEFIHDFYDKYLPPDSKECRHAFFYRMSW